jgi:type IV secretory pathway VirB4 component
MNIKTQIAPKGLEFRSNEFIVSDKYATILTVVSYPKVISPGYLSSLTNMAGIKVVIKHIPMPFSAISKMLNKQIADLRIRYQDEKDKVIQERIRLDVESLEYFVTMISSDQSRIFDFQLHIMVTADSQEELDTRKVQVKNYLDAMQLRAVPLRFEQENVFRSMLPIFEKQELEKRIGTPIPSITIAGMYPFIFDSVKDEGLSVL